MVKSIDFLILHYIIIKPFDYFCMEDGIATVCLNEGEYRTDFFQKYDDFETDHECGYDWELFAESYMRKCFPEMVKDIESDSESGMFCVYSEKKKYWKSLHWN